MTLEEFSPGAVSHPGGCPGRTHDVGEQNRRQDAFGDCAGPVARDELFDLVEDEIRSRGIDIGRVGIVLDAAGDQSICAPECD
jgi:hypothetical protein